MDSFDNRLADIAELTECNDHTEAYLQGCELLEELYNCHIADIKHQLIRIDFEKDLVGYLSDKMNTLRHTQYQKMMLAAKQALNTDEFKKFCRAF